MRMILYFYNIITIWNCYCAATPRIDNSETSNLVRYEYRYSVDESKTHGPVMDRWEHRLGEYVKGAYSVVDPDGSVRTVDYEVDGNKGYHAVVRRNSPSVNLLSSIQLSLSKEIFAESRPIAQNLTKGSPRTGRRLDNDRGGLNFQNNPKETSLEPSGSSTRLQTSPPSTLLLPPSPVNYNVPLTTNIIYYNMPAGFIYQKINVKKKSPETRKLRHSQLVRPIPKDYLLNGVSQLIFRDN